MCLDLWMHSSICKQAHALPVKPERVQSTHQISRAKIARFHLQLLPSFSSSTRVTYIWHTTGDASCNLTEKKEKELIEMHLLSTSHLACVWALTVWQEHKISHQAAIKHKWQIATKKIIANAETKFNQQDGRYTHNASCVIDDNILVAIYMAHVTLEQWSTCFSLLFFVAFN